MPPVSDGQKANAALLNSTYLDKTQDDTTIGKLGLNAPASGAAITNTQQEINDLKDEFNASTGHEHDGVDSKKVVATNLDGTGGSNGQVLKADGAGGVLWDTDTGTGAVNYIGAWDANTNSPALASGVGTKGDYYVVNVAGSTNLDGITDWQNTDWAVFNGTAWEKVDNTDQVLSVASKQGAVVLDSDDVNETATKKWATKNNITASAPDANDDNTQGYSANSRWFDTSTSTLYIAESVGTGAAVWTGISGGGGGGLDVFHTQTFETYTSANASGNNATYLGGGSPSGSESLETTSPISQDNSWKFTAGVSSLNDYFEIEVFDIDRKQRETDVKVRLSCDMSNFNSDVTYIIYDKTNGDVLTDSLDILEAGRARDFYEFSVYVPSNCTQLSWGIHCLDTPTNTETLLIDDVEFSTNPFVYKNLNEFHTIQVDTANGRGSTDTFIRRFSNVTEELGGGLITRSSTAANGDTFTIARDGFYAISYTDIWSSGAQHGISKNSTQLTTAIGNINVADRLGYNDPGAVNFSASVSWSGQLQAGDVIRPHCAGGGDHATAARSTFTIAGFAETEHVVTPMKTARQYSEANGDFTVTGTGWTTGVAVAVPYRTGDGTWRMKFNVSGTKTASTSATLTFSGVTFKAGYQQSCASHGATTNEPTNCYTNPGSGQVLWYTDGSSVANPRFSGDVELDGKPTWADDVNSNYLAAVPVQRTAYLKDVKSSGTQGGTFTSGSWQTRDLNTLSGDTSFITNSSNQFTLSPGLYRLKAKAPAFFCDNHKAKLRNITDSTDDIIGSSEWTDQMTGENGVQTFSVVEGEIEIATSKTYELQHRCLTTYPTSGFGRASTFGVDEVYSQIEITKVK